MNKSTLVKNKVDIVGFKETLIWAMVSDLIERVAVKRRELNAA